MKDLHQYSQSPEPARLERIDYLQSGWLEIIIQLRGGLCCIVKLHLYLSLVRQVYPVNGHQRSPDNVE